MLNRNRPTNRPINYLPIALLTWMGLGIPLPVWAEADMTRNASRLAAPQSDSGVDTGVEATSERQLSLLTGLPKQALTSGSDLAAAAGLAEPGLAEPGLAEPGLVALGLAEPELGEPGLAESDPLGLKLAAPFATFQFLPISLADMRLDTLSDIPLETSEFLPDINLMAPPVPLTLPEGDANQDAHPTMVEHTTFEMAASEISTEAADLGLDNRPVTPPFLNFQASAIQTGDEFSARGRLHGYYFLTPHLLVGGAVDLTTGNAFSDTRSTGFSINELYVAVSPKNTANLRFVVGQLDLTSYFDRNSFAKDSLTHFIHPVFQTNPALAANEIRSRPAALINWRVADPLELRAAAFSSGGIGNFAIDGVAAEAAVQVGTLILRGTYVSATDAGNRDSFPEAFSVDRGGGVFGPLSGDREVAYGVNAEWFIPSLNMGVFGRYGYHENQTLGLSSNTYSGGVNFLDLLMADDRLGIGYGRGLANEFLRQQQQDNDIPDVFEVFYDVRLATNVRAAVDFQQRNSFSETVLGFRIRADFNLSHWLD